MTLKLAVPIVLAAALLIPISHAWSDSECDGLSPAMRGMVDEVLRTEPAYGCCDDTIVSCLALTPTCVVAPRLKNEVCRMARRGFSLSEIKSALTARKKTMDRSAPPAAIVLDERFMAGGADAPVVLAMYACGRSPLCSTFVLALYHEVVDGRLKGKVRLYLRPVYLDGPQGAEKCCRALVAAADQAMFWPYVMHLYYNQNDFQTCLLDKWAGSKGLDLGAFRLAIDRDSTRDFVDDSMLEAKANQVESLPGIFINGRRYSYDLSTEALVNVLEEEWDFVSRAAP